MLIFTARGCVMVAAWLKWLAALIAAAPSRRLTVAALGWRLTSRGGGGSSETNFINLGNKPQILNRK